MSGGETGEPPARREEIDDSRFLEEAEAIARQVWDARFTPDDQVQWIGYNTSEGKPVPVGGNDLYNGRLGVGVYFAATHAVTGDETYREHARKAVDPVVATEPADVIEASNLGAGTGIGSYIYGLTIISEFLDEPTYQRRALELARALTREKIESDTRYDVLCGTAGSLLGLLRLWESSKENDVLTKAIQCGDHLLENRYHKWGRYGVWDTSRSGQTMRVSTGMGHGVGGIAYALYRLYGHTDQDRFRDAADNAVSFENLFYMEHENNWKANLVAIEDFPCWWCYGLAGIGNARLGSLKYHESDQLRTDLERAKRGAEPQLLSDDSICHGTFTLVDFLVELGRVLDEQSLERAENVARRAISRRHQNGCYRVPMAAVDGLSNPVFFLGTAGIGYTLLRLVEPETVPCILRFE